MAVKDGPGIGGRVGSQVKRCHHGPHRLPANVSPDRFVHFQVTVHVAEADGAKPVFIGENRLQPLSRHGPHGNHGTAGDDADGSVPFTDYRSRAGNAPFSERNGPDHSRQIGNESIIMGNDAFEGLKLL